ncbi:hypothetical protein A3F06_01780 [candidate division TM6 bacterium RIFCSPHIGHO2_12_FULL_36_22]|nr:MAG: hypothetical protein A3F06_01780 [candidate division TM6 bacterium RIFCSPHIGHO2_12_FULL_36_22]
MKKLMLSILALVAFAGMPGKAQANGAAVGFGIAGGALGALILTQAFCCCSKKKCECNDNQNEMPQKSKKTRRTAA